MQTIKYKRVLLKLSGEALAGDAKRGLDFDVIGKVCDVVKQCVEIGVQIGIVVGGGNIWRGLKDGGDRMERVRADHMALFVENLQCLKEFSTGQSKLGGISPTLFPFAGTA